MSSNQSANNYLSILPIELLGIFIEFLDIVALTNFISTCKLYRKKTMKYTKFLYIPDLGREVSPASVKWSDNPILIKKEWPNSIICLRLDCLIDYYKTRKYQYMCEHLSGFFPFRKTFGFFTDLPINILKSKDFACWCPYPSKVYKFRIIDFGEYRQVKFINTHKNNIIQFRYKDSNFTTSVHINSEFVMGRHPIYSKNNIVVAHTTIKYIILDNVQYYISCYTEALDFTKWKLK